MSLENTHDIGKVKIVMVGAGGSGASSLSDLSDTNIVNPSNGQLLGYNSLTGKWGNVNGGGGGGDSFACLGIGKKKTVTSGVIDTDIDLHRAPIVGDRLLVWFDAGVDAPTGIITYNDGVAVTSNVESVSSLSYKNGWNIFEFKNDGLLYVNCWVRVQNVPIPNNTLYGLTDTQISATPADGQVLTFDNNKWKNRALPTVQANTGTANAELKKLQIGNVVYNADSIKHYDATSISNGAISVSVPNAGHLDGEIIAVNTGALTGTTSSAWILSLSDGQTIEALTMSKGGSAYTDAITANCLLFVKCDVTNSTAVLLGIAGAGTTVQANPTGTPTAYLDKLKVGNGVYDASAIKPCNVSSITSSTTGVISLPVVDTNIIGKIIAVSTGAYSGTTTNAWALSLTSGGSQVPIAMSKADGTAFTDELTANELLLVYIDTTIDHEQAIVLDIPVNTTEIKTVSGNPITLTDAVAGNALEVSAEITASQDLHGYDKPWVGGAGKNKFDPSIVWKRNNSSSFDGSDVDNNDVRARTVPAFAFDRVGTFTMSGLPDEVTSIIRVECFDASKASLGYATVNDFTFTTLSGTKYIYIWLGGSGFNNITFNSSTMQIEEGSTATAFNPYANICPISGFSSVVITNVDSESQTATVTVSLGSTVYGGTLNLTTGELTIDYGRSDMGGLQWQYDSGLGGFITDDLSATLKLPQDNSTPINGLCEAYPITDRNHFANESLCVNVLGRVCVKSPSQGTNATAFKTAMSGLYLIYELATPTTTTLTAAQLALVKGYNQLSCNSGDMSITYKASGLDALKERVDDLEDRVDDVETALAGKANIEPYLEQSVTLSTSQTTTVTFTDSAFTANSVVDPAISVWGIFPEDVTVANGSCTVVMPKVSTAQTVTVGIFIKR